MHRLRTTAHVLAAACICLGTFSMPLMASLSTPAVPELHAPPPQPERAVVYLAAAPELEPEPEPELEPEPDLVDVPEPPPEVAAAPQPAAAPAPVSPVRAAPVPAPIEASQPVSTASAKPATKTKTATKKRSRRRKDCSPDVSQIDAQGPRRWTVERDLIDHYAKNLDQAARLAYVDWARDPDGKIVGFEVHRIRCGSVLSAVGFEKGDVITAINGRSIHSIAGALRAYVALRLRRKLEVRVTRASGEQVKLRYRLT